MADRSKYKYNNKMVAVSEETFRKVTILAEKGHRPKSKQIELLVDFYVEQHPGALRVEEPLYAEE